MAQAMTSAASGALARAQWGAVQGVSRPRASNVSAAASRGPAGGAVCGRATPSKKVDDKKASKKADKKSGGGDAAAPAAAPAMSKQAKDAARKKAAAAMRDIAAKNAKSYVKIVAELSREEYREYVLSVRHAPADGSAALPILSDWLPIAEVVVADRQAFEAKQFFKENNVSGIPETDQVMASAEQIEGVPAIKATLPSLGLDIMGMTFIMAGPKVKDIPVEELEFGVEDWGSFENACAGLEAQTGTKERMASAAKVLGVNVEDEPAEIKRVYRKLIATEHPDRNPNASIEKFNAIKTAYDLMSDRGGQSGTTFEGLGDKAKRDFVKLEGIKAGGASSTGAAKVVTVGNSKITLAMRSLTNYDRIANIFNARNLSLQSRSVPKPAGASQSVDASADAVDASVDASSDEPAAAPEPVAV